MPHLKLLQYIMDKHSNSDLKISASIVGCTELSINSLSLLFYFYFSFLPDFVKIAFIVFWIACVLYNYGVHKENPHFLLPYMILRVFLCVVIVLMPVFLLGYNFMNGNVFDLLPSLFMASQMLSIEILVSLILGCGACMIFGIQMYFVIVMYSFYKSITQRNKGSFYSHIQEFDPMLSNVYLSKDRSELI